MKKNIIFIGTPEFAVKFLQEINLKHNISLVITGEDKKRSRNKISATPIKIFSIDNELNVITPKNINDKETINKIKEQNPDLLVVVAYGQIIGDELLSLYKDKIINVHPSLLPEFRGASPIHSALLHESDKTGVSIMLMEKELDSGDILLKEEMIIDLDDDIFSLSIKLQDLGVELLLRVIDKFDFYYAERKKQEGIISYSNKISKKLANIDWNNTAKSIIKKINALKEWPIAYTNYKNIDLKILSAKIVDKKAIYEFGQIIEVSKTGILVSANDKIISIEEIQFPNKKRIRVSDYLNGNTIDKIKLG